MENIIKGIRQYYPVSDNIIRYPTSRRKNFRPHGIGKNNHKTTSWNYQQKHRELKS